MCSLNFRNKAVFVNDTIPCFNSLLMTNSLCSSIGEIFKVSWNTYRKEFGLIFEESSGGEAEEAHD